MKLLGGLSGVILAMSSSMLTLTEDSLATDPTIDFTGIVALSGCSGSLVRWTTSRPDDKAMVLTNGHCYEGGFLDPGEVIMNRPSERTMELLNADGQTSLATLQATKIIYATMTDTDVTLYELTKTYRTIATEQGVQALTISPFRPRVGTPIRIVSGYWKAIDSCAIDAFIPALREARWTFRDSIRYTQPGCETVGGWSGSPILNAVTKQIVGIANTGNEQGERCTLNNPCEVDAQGNVTVRDKAMYGQEVYQIYSCLTKNNRLDLTRAGCKLPKPS